MTLRTQKAIDFYFGTALLFVLRPLVMLAGKLTRRPHDFTTCRTITVLKFLGGGSLVIAYPALLALRRRPGLKRMRLVTTPAVAPFAEALGVFDEIITVRDHSGFQLLISGVSAWRRCLGTDTLLDLEVYSRLSTVFGLATITRNRVGFYYESLFWRKEINTHLVYFNRFANVYLFYDQMALLLGVTPVPMLEAGAALRKHLGVPPRDFTTTRRRIAIGQGCSEQGRERMLTSAQWLSVFKKNLRLTDDAEITFLGSEKDHVLAEQTISAVKPIFPTAQFKNACGSLTVRQSIEVLGFADAFWGIDSSLLHLSRLLGVPSHSFWGPTDPALRLRPVPALTETTTYEKIFCSPCIHVTDFPPCEGDNRCIQKLFDPRVVVDGTDPTFTAWPKR